MKKLLILALALLGLWGCNDDDKKATPAQDAYYNLYIPVSNQCYHLYQMFDRAQRLNILLQEADDSTKLNDVKSDDGNTNYSGVFFGDATLTNDNGVVTIDYGSGNLYPQRSGIIRINTHNQLLSDEGAEWEFIEVVDRPYSYQEGYGSVEVVDSWERMTIANNTGVLVCTADDVVIYRQGSKGNKDGNWSLDYLVFPSSGSDASFDAFVAGSRTILVGSSALGRIVGRTELHASQIDDPLVMKLSGPFPYEDIVVEGYQRVSSPEFTMTDPEKYPASWVGAQSVLVGEDRHLIIHYNGETWNAF